MIVEPRRFLRDESSDIVNAAGGVAVVVVVDAVPACGDIGRQVFELTLSLMEIDPAIVHISSADDFSSCPVTTGFSMWGGVKSALSCAIGLFTKRLGYYVLH